MLVEEEDPAPLDSRSKVPVRRLKKSFFQAPEK
jgi:hypothetical protein